MSALPVTDVRNYLTGLQSRIVGALEDAEGAAFRSDSWTRAEGGGGLSRLLEGGALFERAGVLFSHVRARSCRRRPAPTGPSWPAAPGKPWACPWCCIRATPMCRPRT